MGSEQMLLQLKCMCDKHVVCQPEANIHTFLHPSEDKLLKAYSKTNFFYIQYLYCTT